MVASAALALPDHSEANQLDWRARVLMRDRVLKLTRRDSKETYAFTYWRPGQGWDSQGYLTACHLLRDVKYNQQVRIDTMLLDTLFILQTWLAVNGKPHHIQILSGYRTPSHNSRLEGAAKNSMHLYGRAADIYIPGIATQMLSDMGRFIGFGGIGFYPSRGFVHIDTGPIRNWRS